MTRKQVFLIVQSVLCALTAGLLAVSALALYLDGAARQAAGDPFYSIFTREKVMAKLLPLLPLFFAALVRLICRPALGKGEHNALLAACAFGGLWVLQPEFGQVFLWLDGSVNYLWCAVFCLLWLLQLPHL